MIQKVTAMNVRQNLGEILNEIKYRHDSVLITKAGKPVAALVDIEMFNKIRLMKADFDKLTDELAIAYQDVSSEIAEQEIAEAFKKARED